MDLHELDFANIIILRDDLAEVIVHDGIEFDQPLVDRYHEFLISNLNAPFSLLINKKNAYTYDFSAQQNLACIDQIKAIGIVVYNEISRTSTQSLIRFPRDRKWKVEVFSNRDAALNWLVEEQDNCR